MRVAVVGLGWVATSVWLPRLLAHPGFVVAGAVEPDPAAAARAAAALAGRPTCAGHRDVPLDGLDVAFVLTPNHTHADIGGWFLRHGVSVVLEKPTCTNRAEIDALAAAASTGGGRLALSAAARYRADVATLREIVASGVLGTPRLAELSWIRARGIPRRSWFTRRTTSGGGVLVDLGWHLIDVAFDLWGPVRVRDAAAQASADFLDRPDWSASWQGSSVDAAGDVEDQMTALVTTDAYALRLRFAWASHEDADRTVVTLHGTDASVELCTTFGFSPRRVDGSTVLLKRAGVVSPVLVGADPVGAEYDRQLDAFLGLPGDPTATARSLARARDVLDVVDACYAAAEVPADISRNPQPIT